MQKSIKGVYNKIRISELLLDFRYIRELYFEGNREECQYRMKVFYNDLFLFPFEGNDILLSKFKTHLYSSDINGVIAMSGEIEKFLEGQLLSVISHTPRTVFFKRIIFVAGLAIIIILFARLYSPLKERYEKEKLDYQLLVDEDAFKQKTLEDILLLNEALKKYHHDNNSYPKSSEGMDAIISSSGEIKKNWIDGLVPRYIKELPVDPRRSKDPGMQYMYRSDGVDFKLIAHHPLGIEEVVKKHPHLVDPTRPSWAFGVWTEGAKNW